MKFTKMHGLGNDFIFINSLEEKVENPEKMAKILCNRFFGIGGDGLILVLPSNEGDFEMKIFNSDGSEAEMCGNALRCFAKYVYENKLTSKKSITVKTLAGIMKPDLIINDDNVVVSVRVDMGKPRLRPNEIPFLGCDNEEMVLNYPLNVDGNTYYITCVSMGNPHCVIFVDDVEQINLEGLGRQIENHELFPQKTNVEFVEILNRRSVKMKVWERGAGATLACGTGACAAAVAAVLNGLTDREVTVKLPGGNLDILWTEETIFMTGPAAESFSGIVSPSLISDK